METCLWLITDALRLTNFALVLQEVMKSLYVLPCHYYFSVVEQKQAAGLV